MAKSIESDVQTLATFIETYCHGNHSDAAKRLPTLRPQELALLGDKLPFLCEECHKLLTHAVVKRSHCPMDPKPACKHCSNHCYAPVYRQKIREVMKYSGRKLVLSGRVDYLLHLLF